MKIALFQQYYIPAHAKRKQEIIFCLKCNLKNKYIDTIYLLNEREYTFEQLGMNTPEWRSLCIKKVRQILIQERLTYLTAFQTIHAKQSVGMDYYILSNSDIFFDSTLRMLPKYLNANTHRSICLGRHEYRDACKRLRQCGMSPCTRNGFSQDSWIFHSKSLPMIHGEFEIKLQFPLGKKRCDNRIAKLLQDMRLPPINPCRSLRSYHFHTSGFRTYSHKDAVRGDILSVRPSH